MIIPKRNVSTFLYIANGVVLLWGLLYLGGIRPPVMKLIVAVSLMISGFLLIWFFSQQSGLNTTLRVIIIIKPGVSLVFGGIYFVAWYFYWETIRMMSAVAVIACALLMVVLFGIYRKRIVS